MDLQLQNKNIIQPESNDQIEENKKEQLEAPLKKEEQKADGIMSSVNAMGDKTLDKELKIKNIDNVLFDQTVVEVGEKQADEKSGSAIIRSFNTNKVLLDNSGRWFGMNSSPMKRFSKWKTTNS